MNGSFRSLRQPRDDVGPAARASGSSPGMSRGIVLAVAVRRDDVAAARVREPGGKRRGLAEVAAEADHPQARVLGLQRGQLLERVVGAPVVDRQDLVRAAERRRARRSPRGRARRRSATRSASARRRRSLDPSYAGKRLIILSFRLLRQHRAGASLPGQIQRQPDDRRSRPAQSRGRPPRRASFRKAIARSPYQTASSPSPKYRMPRPIDTAARNCQAGTRATPASEHEILNGAGGGRSAGTATTRRPYFWKSRERPSTCSL